MAGIECDDEPVSLIEAQCRPMNMIEAINDALDIMLERDPDVIESSVKSGITFAR